MVSRAGVVEPKNGDSKGPSVDDNDTLGWVQRTCASLHCPIKGGPQRAGNKPVTALGRQADEVTFSNSVGRVRVHVTEELPYNSVRSEFILLRLTYMPLDSVSYNSPLRAGITQTKWRTSSCTSSKRSRVFDPLADRLLVDIVDHCHHHHLAVASYQAEGSSSSVLSDFCSYLVITEPRAICHAYQGAPRMQSMGSRALRHRLCRLSRRAHSMEWQRLMCFHPNAVRPSPGALRLTLETQITTHTR
ncbi:hypothetical protein HBI56_142710 [Parastagonospora nodorum]|nr:hypothetical protein HBH54_065090 [Parastagonospora nodorum]KAH4001968.1 hypothetical protein HBI10_082060 [Parastagonospora nodorum]KAH4039810.1 hypothetical protein HBI09_037100 [Parastagonospora nodorum]KAH4047232.1 hypothetical protein HBH49_171370 [Parastagonospora nodorum]KAH4075822.1 hypothetical protein HBH50_022100 [Parastagonospora nodorum]